jgi:NAD(P)-dependent dehydrogenase (short-subunit alcohol dehydrogenase family)
MGRIEILSNKSALITGGSKGIGLGIAEAMAKEGMRIAITSRNQEEALVAADRLVQMGAQDAIGLECDVRDWEAQREGVQQIISRWGQLDVVIANAGVGHFASVDVLPHHQWHEIIDTNLTGVFYTLQAGIEALKASKGYFITIASLAGTNFFINGAAYNASKFGLVGFTQAAMLDLRPHDIKVSTIMPGSVATYFNQHIPGEQDTWKIQPVDIGQIVIDLLYMNPRTLPSKIEVRPSRPPG